MGIRSERRKKWAETTAREKAEREARNAKKAREEFESNPYVQALETRRKAAIWIKKFKKENGREPSESELISWLVNKR
jgi:hypothetical protein